MPPLRLVTAFPGHDVSSPVGNAQEASGVDITTALAPPRTRIIAVTGGKGGVGKSNVAVNVALELAARRRRVTLLDADLALANTDVLLGINPTYHLGHVLSGHCSLSEVIVEVEGGVRLIPGGSGIERLANLAPGQHGPLIAELCTVENKSDYMIVDTAAGIAHNVTGVLRAVSEAIVVTTPDPAAIIDAYATIKVLHRHSPNKPVWIIVNDVAKISDANQIFTQIRSTAAHFLNHPVRYLGTIPHDAVLAEAVREQVPIVEYAPKSPASRALRLIAKHLDQSDLASPTSGSAAESFWHLLVEPEV